MNIDDIYELVTTEHTESLNGVDVRGCLQQFHLSGAVNSYLSWRFRAEAAGRTDPRETVTVMAKTAGNLTSLLSDLERKYPNVLANPRVAAHALTSQAEDLTDGLDLDTSLDGEKRKLREQHRFLREATVLALLCDKALARRIFEQDLDLPTEAVLNKIADREGRNLEGKALIDKLEDIRELMGAIQQLMSMDDLLLDAFCRRSRQEFDQVRRGQFEFLNRDWGVKLPPKSRNRLRPPTRLGIQVLPAGTGFRDLFDEASVTNSRWSGFEIDPRRLSVLDDLITHFGEHRCERFIGVSVGRTTRYGAEGDYLVLVVKQDSSHEDAVAISPLARVDAPYVVRQAVTGTTWLEVLSGEKHEARDSGARSLRFSSPSPHLDEYEAMVQKIILLLECPPYQFSWGFRFDRVFLRYTLA